MHAWSKQTQQSVQIVIIEEEKVNHYSIPLMDLLQIYEKGGVCSLEICEHNQGFCIEQPLYAVE